jgi:polyphosphate kinase
MENVYRDYFMKLADYCSEVIEGMIDAKRDGDDYAVVELQARFDNAEVDWNSFKRDFNVRPRGSSLRGLVE